jgi:hypothetical protein
MGAHTANSGDVYFPAGTPDPSDVQGTAVDLEGSVWREIAEETGLSSADLVAEPGWYAVPAGAYLALIKIVRAREPAIALRARILEYLRREAAPELSDIRIARDTADIDPHMPSFVTAFLRYCWTQE